MRKRGGISLSITGNITMCRKRFESGRGRRGSERHSRVSIPMPLPSLHTSTLVFRPVSGAGDPIGVAAR